MKRCKNLSKYLIILAIIIILLVILFINHNTIKEIPVDNKNIVLQVGESKKIIINSNIKVLYKSSNENIAKINDDGIINGIKDGLATITVYSRDNKAKTNVYVKVIDNSELNINNIEMISSNTISKDYIKKGDKLVIKIIFNHNLNKEPKILINNNEIVYHYNPNTDNIIIEKIIDDEEELNLNIYIDNELKDTYKLPIVDNQLPTCTLNYSNKKITISGEDNYGIDSYSMSKSKNAIYSSNKELNNPEYGTWYGFVRDYAGNVGECSIEVSNIIDLSKITIIGDSRTEDLCRRSWYKQNNGACVAKVSAGYRWLESTAVEQVNNLSIDKKKYIVTNLGANDPHNVKKYISLYENLSQTSWHDSMLFILSVNPTSGKHSYLNSEINSFNYEMAQLASKYDNISYCDSNSYLKKNGFQSYDGQHYDESTDKEIYNYLIKCMQDFYN